MKSIRLEVQIKTYFVAEMNFLQLLSKRRFGKGYTAVTASAVPSPYQGPSPQQQSCCHPCQAWGHRGQGLSATYQL